MRIAVFACALALSACAGTGPGRLEANRFQSENYPYALFYAPMGRPEYPLGPYYTLENFYQPDGQRRYPRVGGEYTIDRTYADESPAVVGSEPFYDLLLVRDGEPKARFWLRSVPLAKAELNVPLATFAERYLEAVAKSGRAAAPFGLERAAEPSPAQLRGQVSRACELSKREALRVDFELENPKHGADEPDWRSVSVILVRTGYFARDQYPVLMLVGSVSDKAGDEKVTQDFDRMLSLLALGDVGQGLTMKGGSTCTSDGAASAPAPGAAPTAPNSTGTSGGERTPELEVPIIQEDAPGSGAP